ncbi:TetR/AcrR family transcriptional regulator [Noviherbaspirillum sedimenti]|uniref:TetR family transcriptional regulator n=1 Tax=Noviherbaspirillum sedimenti TaxID=2320865 RepID=A0A3A3G891_9BURK|nr:TetR/AcrR family transcriptional regulator [Noviherbaspirillum sedimenti]RJG04191.1 TetR family transcriptional regulator [Noviherbaspirillum sedimenti]
MATKPPAKTQSPRGRVDKRALLIEIGTAIFTQKGFSSTGLDEIVQAAEVPKGSFYYYFPSKDEYAIEVIRNYAQYFARKLERTLEDDSLTPLERLKAFTRDAASGVQRFEFKRGCLIGNLGQEMASIEEEFRVVLLEVLSDWRNRFRICLDEAKAIKEITTQVDSAELARFFWSAWEGAVLCAKLERSTAPLENVSRLFFEQMLQPAAKNKT